MDKRPTVSLGTYSARFDRGASAIVEALWMITSIFVCSPAPGSNWRVSLLRLFGATIGSGVVIKPRVRVKFPWRLVVGSDTWIGEGVWIDNLGNTRIGHDCCISQGAYLCTGSHDWTSRHFHLRVSSLLVEDYAWIGAFVVVGPGAEISEGTVIALGSVVTSKTEPWSIYQGNPATSIRTRDIRAE
jgi:putative colanic acid biosynthesis acetyltransferase WcaF